MISEVRVTIALIFAGGDGIRMGADIPKQYLMLGDRPVLAHTLCLYADHPSVDGIYLVVSPIWENAARKMVSEYAIGKIRGFVHGGETAQDSIYKGLAFIARHEPKDTIVLVHDGARPYVTPDVISANIDSVRRFGSAITYTPCFETVVLSHDGKSIDGIPVREDSYVAQAPQSFRLGDILAAHEKVRASVTGYRGLVDQATLCHSLGIGVHLVPGCRGNIKVTTPEDLVTLRALIEWRGSGHG